MCLEWISLIVDIVLTIVTAVMAFATYQMANSTKKSVDEMKLTREETNSAEVIMYLEVESHRMYLIIENIGKTVAKDVKIKFEPTLINSIKKQFNDLKEISYLPPKYKIKTFFDMVYDYYEIYKEYPHVKFIISYENIYGKFIERKYESDLHYLNDLGFLASESETVEISLYEIKEEFQKTNKKFDEIYGELKKYNKT